MIVTLVVELEDKPGQLLKVIEPISKFGGNVISIVHERGKKTPLKRIPVEFTIDIDPSKLKTLIEKLTQSGIYIRSYNEIRLSASITLLLIGHVVHTDLSDTINKIDSTGFAEIVEMKISMPNLNEPSTAMVTISAIGKEKLREAIEILKKVCKDKGIEVIEPLNDDVI